MIKIAVLAIAAIALANFAFRLLRWITTPILRRLGFYRYYAPLFFIQPFGRNRVELHLGTSWDLMKAEKLTPQAIMSSLVMGIGGLVDDVKCGRLKPALRVRATTYFLSESTLRRFGFVVRRPDIWEYIAFLGNYVEVCLLRSIVAGRPQVVDLRRVRMAETTLQQLVDRETIVGHLMTHFVAKSRGDVSL
jgi:hypothetical protein